MLCIKRRLTDIFEQMPGSRKAAQRVQNYSEDLEESESPWKKKSGRRAYNEKNDETWCPGKKTLLASQKPKKQHRRHVQNSEEVDEQRTSKYVSLLDLNEQGTSESVPQLDVAVAMKEFRFPSSSQPAMPSKVPRKRRKSPKAKAIKKEQPKIKSRRAVEPLVLPSEWMTDFTLTRRNRKPVFYGEVENEDDVIEEKIGLKPRKGQKGMKHLEKEALASGNEAAAPAEKTGNQESVFYGEVENEDNIIEVRIEPKRRRGRKSKKQLQEEALARGEEIEVVTVVVKRKPPRRFPMLGKGKKYKRKYRKQFGPLTREQTEALNLKTVTEAIRRQNTAAVREEVQKAKAVKSVVPMTKEEKCVLFRDPLYQRGIYASDLVEARELLLLYEVELESYTFLSGKICSFSTEITRDTDFKHNVNPEALTAIGLNQGKWKNPAYFKEKDDSLALKVYTTILMLRGKMAPILSLWTYRQMIVLLNALDLLKKTSNRRIPDQMPKKFKEIIEGWARYLEHKSDLYPAEVLPKDILTVNKINKNNETAAFYLDRSMASILADWFEQMDGEIEKARKFPKILEIFRDVSCTNEWVDGDAVPLIFHSQFFKIMEPVWMSAEFLHEQELIPKDLAAKTKEIVQQKAIKWHGYEPPEYINERPPKTPNKEFPKMQVVWKLTKDDKKELRLKCWGIRKKKETEPQQLASLFGEDLYNMENISETMREEEYNISQDQLQSRLEHLRFDKAKFIVDFHEAPRHDTEMEPADLIPDDDNGIAINWDDDDVAKYAPWEENVLAGIPEPSGFYANKYFRG